MQAGAADAGKGGTDGERLQLRRTVFMPIACAASSSSRIACQAQPTRESRSRREASSAAPISTTNQVVVLPLSRSV